MTRLESASLVGGVGTGIGPARAFMAAVCPSISPRVRVTAATAACMCSAAEASNIACPGGVHAMGAAAATVVAKDCAIAARFALPRCTDSAAAAAVFDIAVPRSLNSAPLFWADRDSSVAASLPVLFQVWPTSATALRDSPMAWSMRVDA
ncbi:hypothetical protein [Rhodococcus sp. MEB032]|uniref:hypothetical protein n=1 Tax=Rhodococcus sp. MEB032 TaxID=3040322 RepID=UPI00254F2FC7|nr:hypothetical protein [Rhodococcus sp. MEB032]